MVLHSNLPPASPRNCTMTYNERNRTVSHFHFGDNYSIQSFTPGLTTSMKRELMINNSSSLNYGDHGRDGV